jgi:hypothetical protein
MEKHYEIEMLSQNSVYNKNDQEYKRKVKTYFTVPDNGINEDTGLLLFIAGFGGHSNSNVYKNMRNKYSDLYNVVTVQCDYFGYEFMQKPLFSGDILNSMEKFYDCFSKKEISEIFIGSRIDDDKLMEYGKKYDFTLEILENLSETIDNFNDMGVMQAVDNLVALLNVLNILYDNQYVFNSKKIIIYGQSHGSYLAYMCNAFAPGLFSLIIDNSGWLFPRYMSKGALRTVDKKYGKMIVKAHFRYTAQKLIKDQEIQDLRYVYSQFVNQCNIISYHGVQDRLIAIEDKKNFCSNVPNNILHIIDETKIDYKIFKSCGHGLEANFLKLFEYTMDNLPFEFEKGTGLALNDKEVFYTEKNRYTIDYRQLFPRISMEPR